MSTLTSVASAVALGAGGALVKAYGSGMLSKLSQAAGEETVSRAVSIAKAAMARDQAQSLISYTQAARVEPILLMDQKAVYVPFIQDVVHTMSSLFTSYYLQAIALDTTLSGIKVVKRLDKFNPDRNLSNATQALLTNMESYKYGLPFPGQSVGLEAYGLPAMEADETPASTLSARDVGKMATEIANLAVGQIIEVTITEGDQSAKIPVSIRLRVTGMASNVLVETMAVGGVDITAGSRFRQWRAGELKFWADLVMAQDRIEAHKKAVLGDKSGYYQAVTKRSDKNLLVEVMSQGGPSVGTASSIIVLTEQTKLDLERTISGRLSDYKTRERIFANTFAMLMAVVDPDWETVVIYHRGIEMPTELTAKDVKKASGGQGPNIAEILQAYQLGSAPSRL